MIKGLKRNGSAVVTVDRRAYEEAKARKERLQKVDEMSDRLDRIEQMLERLLDVKKD